MNGFQHSDPEELVSCGGDDHVGLKKNLQVLVSGQETPVLDVRVQLRSGLREDVTCEARQCEEVSSGLQCPPH